MNEQLKCYMCEKAGIITRSTAVVTFANGLVDDPGINQGFIRHCIKGQQEIITFDEVVKPNAICVKPQSFGKRADEEAILHIEKFWPVG